MRKLGVGSDREKRIHRARYAAIAREIAIPAEKQGQGVGQREHKNLGCGGRGQGAPSRQASSTDLQSCAAMARMERRSWRRGSTARECLHFGIAGRESFQQGDQRRAASVQRLAFRSRPRSGRHHKSNPRKPKLSPRRRSTIRLFSSLISTCSSATQHMLHDFGKYDLNGTNAVQRWYKFDWKESTDGLVRKISDTLSTIVRNHIESTAKRLSGMS